MTGSPARRDLRPLVAGAVVLWIAVSPWLWGFAGSHAAIADHVAMVLGVGPITLMIVALRPAAFVAIAAGIWLVFSPWVLGYATDHQAWANELITGLLLIVLAANAGGLWSRSRAPRRPITTSARGLEATEPPLGQ